VIAPPEILEELELDGPERLSPLMLEGMIRDLLAAQTLAEIRGYDLVAKLYESEWQLLFLRYMKALDAARRRWMQVVWHAGAGGPPF
jgi:hypothetical protein